MRNDEMNSPFRYAGGKFYARKLIIEHIPSHNFYIEPFAGGASIFFAKPKTRHNWLNDADPELSNCLTIIRDHPLQLIDFLSKERATKERHAYFKNEYTPKNNIQRAGRWYYLNRTSYSGIMQMKNCYWGYGEKYSMRPENWPRNIIRTSAKLQDVKITCLDFEEVIKNAPKGSFLFIDPPYYNADQNKFYECFFSTNDHHRLQKTLHKRTKDFKFLITYDNSKEVRELYSWVQYTYDKEWNYTLNRTDDQSNGTDRKGQRYKGQEIFILNFDSLAQQNIFDFDDVIARNEERVPALVLAGAIH